MTDTHDTNKKSHIRASANFNGVSDSGENPDPRLVALVRLMARNAAETDYEKALKQHRRQKKKVE